MPRKNLRAFCAVRGFHKFQKKRKKMEFINNMEVAEALYQCPCIEVKKTFFGLKKDILYTQTNSIVKGTFLEYDCNNGRRVEMLLSTPWESMEAVTRKIGYPQPAENGMYCLSLCYSCDRRFAVLQLSRYYEFDYHPVSKIRFAEGDEAETLLKPFLR